MARGDWIPADERIPEDGKDVLWSIDVFGNRQVYKIGHYMGQKIFADDGVTYWLTARTYWMQLPEPPKVK